MGKRAGIALRPYRNRKAKGRSGAALNRCPLNLKANPETVIDHRSPSPERCPGSPAARAEYDLLGNAGIRNGIYLGLSVNVTIKSTRGIVDLLVTNDGEVIAYREVTRVAPPLKASYSPFDSGL